MVAWYCKIDGVEHGPLSQDELVKMASGGRISPNDLVRNEKKNKWYKAGKVQGLKFPNDQVPDGPPTRRGSDSGKPAEQSDAGTSAEAIRLLKGFGKKNQDSERGAGADVTVRSRDADDDDWKPRTATVMQAVERKPLSPLTKRILWAAAAILLALLLFPPHRVPAEYVAKGKQASASGRLTGLVFLPPTMKVDVTGRGVGGLKVELTVDETDGKTYGDVPLPVNLIRLLIECLVVILVAGAACVILAARDEGADSK